MKQDKSEKDNRKRLPRKITESYLHNAGLYYLQRFAASKAHFKSVMMRKVKRSCMHHQDQNFEACKELVEKLADKFETLGLLNDELYTQGMITSLRRKGLSRKTILSKMALKGIEPGKASTALQTYDNNTYEQNGKSAELYAALTLARRKKIGPFAKDGKQDSQKALARLARAGFSYETARRVLDIEEDADLYL